MNNPYAVNTWLNPVVQNYLHYFGACEKPVVWEVGSRDGHDGVELAKRIYSGSDDWFWTRTKVICLEPNPDQVKVIKENYSEVEVIPVAASNQSNSKVDFMVYEGDEGAVGSSSLNLDWKENDLPGHVIKVQTVELKDYIGDEEIDIMKIDVEGHSLEVLEGLGDKLKQVKVFHIESEVWTNSYVKIKAFMMTKNYVLVDESEQYSGMPDLVYVRL